MQAYDIINYRISKDPVRLTVQGQDRKWEMKQDNSLLVIQIMMEILEVRV